MRPARRDLGVPCSMCSHGLWRDLQQWLVTSKNSMPEDLENAQVASESEHE